VDINEESVEIAKLALWLRTAKPQRKLNSLNNNIKCGNSLISDPEVAGEKAFDWHREFPHVFEKGGFDVVIGNPPYVDNRGFDKNVLNYFYKAYTNSFQKSGTDKFKTTKLNLITLFIELTNKILKTKGYTSYIFHKNIFKTNGYTAIRKYILYNYDILLLTDWGAGQFQDVVAETGTFVLRKGEIEKDNIKVDFFDLDKKYLENYQSQNSFKNAYEFIFGIYASDNDRKILEKILEEIQYLEVSIKDMTFEKFDSDETLKRATAMTLINIGELARLLSEEFKENTKNIPFKEIIATRNIAAHGYKTLRFDDIFKTITTDIPDLKKKNKLYA
jgi:uncharacterized protein with HEPN domain